MPFDTFGHHKAFARAVAMSLGDSRSDTKEDVMNENNQNIEEETIQPPFVKDLLLTCSKLLQMKESLAFPIRNLMVIICSQNDGAVARAVALTNSLVKVASDLFLCWVPSSCDSENSLVPKWTSVLIDEDKQNKLLPTLGLSLKNISIQEQKGLIEIACHCITKQLASDTMHAVLQLCSTLTRTHSVVVRFLDAGDPQTLQQAMESEIRHSVAAQSRCQVEMLGERPYIVLLKDKCKEKEKIVEKDKAQTADGKAALGNINNSWKWAWGKERPLFLCLKRMAGWANDQELCASLANIVFILKLLTETSWKWYPALIDLLNDIVAARTPTGSYISAEASATFIDEEVMEEEEEEEEDGVILRLEEGINGINIIDHFKVLRRDHIFANKTLHVMPIEIFGSRRQRSTTSIYNLLGSTGNNITSSQHTLFVEPSSSLHTASLRQSGPEKHSDQDITSLEPQSKVEVNQLQESAAMMPENPAKNNGNIEEDYVPLPSSTVLDSSGNADIGPTTNKVMEVESLQSLNVEIGSSDGHDDGGERQENHSLEIDQVVQAGEQLANGDADSGPVDPAFLDLLPEKLHAEVLSAQQGQVAQPSNAESQNGGDIDPEFLAALPPDIREEVLLTSSHDMLANLTPALGAEANMLLERFANHYNRTLFGTYPRNRRDESSRRGEGASATHESENLDKARGKAVMIVEEDTIEGNNNKEGSFSIALLLNLLSQPLYLRSIAHLEQLLNLLEVIIDNVESKSGLSDVSGVSAAEQTSGPQISTSDAEIITGSHAISSGSDIGSPKPDDSSKPSASSENAG
ncbi:hypothetical protein Acr_28g0001020 [Actinidia rufa]|uniref:Uncharacterized protein n=1 Tax=Actinidia rufa TaxID=165716 RepID=A0A7J0H8G6_9ERIC|nr:hypothetical protein Acr_28g0001020 [Actinidia rufa]